MVSKVGCGIDFGPRIHGHSRTQANGVPQPSPGSLLTTDNWPFLAGNGYMILLLFRVLVWERNRTRASSDAFTFDVYTTVH